MGAGSLQPYLLCNRGLGLKQVPLDVNESLDQRLLAAQFPPQGVKGFVESFDHVKAIDDVDGLGKEALADRVVGRSHIVADGLNLGAEFRAKLFEMSDQRLLRAVG